MSKMGQHVIKLHEAQEVSTKQALPAMDLVARVTLFLAGLGMMLFGIAMLNLVIPIWSNTFGGNALIFMSICFILSGLLTILLPKLGLEH